MWLYHVYKDIWEAAIGEELPCEQEPRNTKDRYAGAVSKYLHSGLVTPCNMCNAVVLNNKSAKILCVQ